MWQLLEKSMLEQVVQQPSLSASAGNNMPHTLDTYCGRLDKMGGAAAFGAWIHLLSQFIQHKRFLTVPRADKTTPELDQAQFVKEVMEGHYIHNFMSRLYTDAQVAKMIAVALSQDAKTRHVPLVNQAPEIVRGGTGRLPGGMDGRSASEWIKQHVPYGKVVMMTTKSTATDATPIANICSFDVSTEEQKADAASAAAPSAHNGFGGFTARENMDTVAFVLPMTNGATKN